MLKIKIAYFDLNHTGNLYDDYSINAKRYGGGGVFAKWAKELWNNEKFEFYIFAPAKTFDNIGDNENKKACVVFNEQLGERARNCLNIKDIIPNIDYFDIIMHGSTNVAINNQGCRPIQVHWAGFGRASDGHPFIPYTLLYGPNVNPYFRGQRVFPIKIGKPVSKTFTKNEKGDYIFQCSRHDISLDSIPVAKNCIKHGVRAYFAGPIREPYPLLDYIDNKHTFYLGEISDNLKNQLAKEARLATFLTPFGAVFNQSVIECLAVGTPIMRLQLDHDTLRKKDLTFQDWIGEIIQPNYNGFIYQEDDFLESFELAKFIDQKNCWETARNFSVEEMMLSFEKAIDIILKDNHRDL